ncbi:hypothetical protein FRC02_010770 [Tulasnella sp. 418]|nr:hypothetical protein FRC02_010770 [Tulasnella sp. 418]
MWLVISAFILLPAPAIIAQSTNFNCFDDCMAQAAATAGCTDESDFACPCSKLEYNTSTTQCMEATCPNPASQIQIFNIMQQSLCDPNTGMATYLASFTNSFMNDGSSPTVEQFIMTTSARNQETTTVLQATSAYSYTASASLPASSTSFYIPPTSAQVSSTSTPGPSASVEPSASRKNSINLPVIIGGAVAGAVAIALIVLLLLVKRRKSWLQKTKAAFQHIHDRLWV